MIDGKLTWFESGKKGPYYHTVTSMYQRQVSGLILECTDFLSPNEKLKRSIFDCGLTAFVSNLPHP